jgi:hypothetical protein
MKQLSIKLMTAVLMLSSISFYSCKKGDTGAPGAPGAPGADGNANVTQISFAAKTIVTGGQITLTLNGITKAIAEKSMILSYGKASNGLWYQLPGFSISGLHEYRTFLTAQDPSSTLTLQMVTGTTAETFDPIRVVIIPANVLLTGRGPAPYDISDYESVRAYFNLPQ